MIGAPFLAGFLSSTANQTAYQVPVSTPVPPGCSVVVVAGAAGSPEPVSVTDLEGNDYALAVSESAAGGVQAWVAIGVAGLNQVASDYWTVTYPSANALNKNILVIGIPGCAAVDVAVPAGGTGTDPTASGTAQGGNEIALAVFQSAAGGGLPTGTSPFEGISALSPSGQQSTGVYSAVVTESGPVAVSGTITSAAWAVLLLSLTAAPVVALGNQSPPSGGVQLPPYPVLPSPRTWSPSDMLLAPLLRADPGNALTLLANPPLAICGQTTTTQSIPSNAITTLALDTELTDSWQSHSIPGREVYPPLAGWHLCEGFAFVNDTSSSTVVTTGIQARQNGVVTSCDGGKTGNNGTNFPIPVAVDLIDLNPQAGDAVALYVWQDSGSNAAIASAWLKTEWVAASSGTVVSGPAAAAAWTTGGTTLLQSAAAGADVIVVWDPSGITVGGVIMLDPDATVAENVTVTSVSGQTIGITACLWPHVADAPVAVPVSAAFMNEQVRDKIHFLAYPPVARLTTQGTSQTIPSQAWPACTPVTFSDPTTSGYRCVDNFTGWTSGQPAQYTFQQGGSWDIYGQVYLQDASSPVNVSAGLSISGATPVWGDRTLSTGVTGAGVCATVRRPMRVAPGQYVQLVASQNSGGSLGVFGTAGSHSRLVCIWRGF